MLNFFRRDLKLIEYCKTCKSYKKTKKIDPVTAISSSLGGAGL